jgi:hypothetical protein
MKVNLNVHMSYFHNNQLLSREETKVETVEEFLARGGQITTLPTGKSDPTGCSTQVIREALRIYQRREAAQLLANKKS